MNKILKMNNIIEEVRQERFKQDEKWGEQNHYPVGWNAILGEEIGEVAKEVVEFTFYDKNSKQSEHQTLKNMRVELIQSAAVVIAMIESLDRNQLNHKELN